MFDGVIWKWDQRGQKVWKQQFLGYSFSIAHRSSHPSISIMIYFQHQLESEGFFNILRTLNWRNELGRITCLGMSTKEEAASRVKVCRVTMTILVEGYDVTSCWSSCRELEARLASWCMCCRIGINFNFKSTGVAKPATRKRDIGRVLVLCTGFWQYWGTQYVCIATTAECRLCRHLH